MECVSCSRTDEETSLQKCPICHKHYCEEHRHQMGGRTFCSRYCAEYFFFSDEED